MKYLKLILLGFYIFSLTACDYSNSATAVTPDTLAKAINSFEPNNMGIDRPSVCGEYFANPEKAKQNSLINVNSPAFQNTCKNYAKRLTHHLNQNANFKDIQDKNLMSQETWQHYFQSKFAQGSD